MSHPDDTAQAVDPKCIDIVIDAAAIRPTDHEWHQPEFHP